MHNYSLYNFIYIKFCKMVVVLPFNQPKFGKHQMYRCMYHFQVKDKSLLPSHASALLQKAIPSGWPCICVLCICRDLTANAPHLGAIHTSPAVLLINWALCAQFFHFQNIQRNARSYSKRAQDDVQDLQDDIQGESNVCRWWPRMLF